MTDKTNVITVTQPNLDWINKNVPGSSKQKRLEHMLAQYKAMVGCCIFHGRLDEEAMTAVRAALASHEGETVRVCIIEVPHE